VVDSEIAWHLAGPSWFDEQIQVSSNLRHVCFSFEASECYLRDVSFLMGLLGRNNVQVVPHAK
jgi:hypothetical protein